MNKYVQLKLVDSWGHQHLLLRNKKVEFANKQKVSIKWPNGVIEDQTLSLIEIQTPVTDQGQTYHVKNVIPTFFTKLNGKKISFPLYQLKILETDITNPRF
jgi:hypothetical protein